MNQAITRREFGKLSGVALFVFSLGMSMFTWGCALITDIINWVPVGQKALAGVIAVLQANGISIVGQAALILTDVQDGLSTLVSVCQSIANPSTPTATEWAKVDNALTAVLNGFVNFLNALAIPIAPIATIVVAATEVILTTLSGFLAQVPASALPKVSAFLSRPVRVWGKTLNTVAIKRSVHRFAHDFNTAMGSEKEGHIKLGLREHFE